MVQNPPPGVQQLTTRLAYRDPQAALDFLEGAFGFPERKAARLEGVGGSIIVTEVQIGDSYLMVGSEGAHTMATPLATSGPTACLLVYVDDVDAHFARAQAGGATIIAEPGDQYWGDRRYEAKDPEGHLWFFQQRTRDVPQSEIDAIEAGFREG